VREHFKFEDKRVRVDQ